MSTHYKGMVGLGILVIIGTSLWLYKRYETIKATVFEAKRVETAAYIQNRASTLIKPEDFSEQDTVRQQKVLEAFFEAIQSPEIFRIKVYNHEPRIIWSNLIEIIGQDASTNQEAKDALKGKITSEFRSLKSEEVSERGFTEFIEAYIPIRDATGEIVGVVEIYQAAGSAKTTIKREFRKSAIYGLTVAMVAYFLVASVLWSLMRTRRGVQN